MSYSTETAPTLQMPALPQSRILIVEDEFITINTLQIMLQKAGYSVSGYAFSVSEALAMIETQRPDMVLLDIFLQGDDNGISLAQHLNKQNIPFIFISAYANAGLIEEAKATRPYGYLVKPFREQDVLVTLEIAGYRYLNRPELSLQKEQNLLLRLGRESARVQTRGALVETLQKELKTVLPLENIALTFLNEDSLNCISILCSKQPGTCYESLTKINDTVVQTYLEWLSELSEMAVVPLKDWLRLFPGDQKILPKAEKNGIECAVIPLWQAGKLIGGLALLIEEPNILQRLRIQLFIGIGDLVSGILGNILAHGEKMRRNKEDMLGTMLVQALSEAGNWEQKLIKAAKVIQKYISFDIIVLGHIQAKSANPLCIFCRIGFDDYQVIQAEDLLQMLGIAAKQYEEVLRELENQQAAIWQGAEFEKICQRYHLKGLVAKKFNLQSNLAIPLPTARGGTFVISLYSREQNVYLPADLTLLERLKPSLALTIDRLLAFGELEIINQQSGKGVHPLPQIQSIESGFEGIIGQSTTLKKVFELIAQVAPVNTTVLLSGESGTGKELFTQAIHKLSPRKGKPLIKVNCATMPANLIESELFGHEKGAFTGAIEKRTGKFELADGGTIFLDEIGEMPLDLQVKLLRVLQEREIERIGGRFPVKIDVRIIAATNRDLKTEVAEGRFRLDLYYRLNVFPVELPPLRERREDIPLLAAYFSSKYSHSMNKPFRGFSENVLNEFANYSWPGNIRELENIVERMVILNNGQSMLEIANPITADKDVTKQPGYSALPAAKPKSLMDTELL